MAKSPDAFRTISEVADWLGIQAHVLRFWESKFTQVKPIKRAGGRRYYRPGDMLLLGGIKKLLHDDGLTIKGVQKILREEGMSHVADMSSPLDELTLSQLGDAEPAARKEKPATAIATPEEEKGVVLSFGAGSSAKSDEPKDTVSVVEQDVNAETETDAGEKPETAAPDQTAQQVEDAPDEVVQSETADSNAEVAKPAVEPKKAEDTTESDEADPEKAAEEPVPVAALPAFLRRPLVDPDPMAANPDVQDAPEPQSAEPKAAEPDTKSPEPTAPAPKKPRVIDLPAFMAEADFEAAPATLTAAFRARKVAPANVKDASALLVKLAALRDQMASRRRPSPPPPSQD